MSDVFLVQESDDRGETKAIIGVATSFENAVGLTGVPAEEFDGWMTSGDRCSWQAIRGDRTWYYIEQMPLDENWWV